MTKLLALTTIAVLATASAAFAADSSDINSDQNAIAKDNSAIANQNNNIAQNRAKKAYDKANDNNASQAVDSTKIGANQLTKTEKKGEKNVDQRILNHDQNNQNQ